MCAKSLQLCLTLCDPWQEYWSGLPCPPPADFPNRIPWEGEQSRNFYFSCISRRVLYIGATWEAPSGFAAGLQFFPVAQTVKNLPEMQEMGVRSLGWEDPLEREWQPTPVFLPGESHEQRSLAGYSPWGCKKVGTQFNNKMKLVNLLTKRVKRKLRDPEGSSCRKHPPP